MSILPAADPTAACDVLVVEDDATAALLLTSIITGMGHLPRTARSGAETVLKIAEQTPDLVLLDLGLPDVDGRDLARQVREAHPAGALPIIFVSGDQEAATRVEAFASGAADFVTKPYDVGEVRARVTHQLEMLALRRALEDATVMLEDRVQERTADLARSMEELRAEIGRREALEEQLRHLAETDPLTNLLNRRGLAPRLDELVQLHGAAVVAAVEVDEWDSVIALLGDAHADTMLRSLARRLGELDVTALIGSLGRNQVVIATHDAAPGSTALVDEICRQLEAPVGTGDGAVRLSCSVGAVRGSAEQGATADSLLRDARLALHEAKRMGEPFQLDDEARRRLLTDGQLERELWGAGERGELHLVFQPVYRATDGIMEGVEALVRWQHPVRGEVGPARFIPGAERSGAIHEVGAWTLDAACRQLAAWRAAGVVPRGCSMAVNVSALEAMDPDLPARVVAALAAAGLPPATLKIELTETAIVSHFAVVRDTLVALRDIGVDICLDDFGTGYSSLAMLREIPATVVKIDRSFVADLHRPASRAIVDATVELAHRLGQRVVAEGLEDGAQLRALVESGCDALQGYFLARPVPGTQIATGALNSCSARLGSVR